LRFFFRSKKVKIISAISILLILSIVICGFVFDLSAPASNLMTSIFSPAQKLFYGISESINENGKVLEKNEKLREEIKELKNELAEKNNKLIDYEKAKRQNEFYKDFLEIKEENPSFKFNSATVISINNNDTYATFSVDKGSVDGIEVYDPVITADGLIGYVCDVYSNQSTIMTVLNPNINISAIDNHSMDTGIVTGNASLSVDGLTNMIYIPSDNTVSVGDFVVTSGEGGIFPKDLIIGTVVEVKTSNNKISCEAKIQPIIDFSELSDVMILTDF